MGSTAFISGSNFDVRLAGNGAGQFDVLAVTGTVTLGTSNLNLSLLNNFNPGTLSTITILNNDGTDAVVGRFGNTTNTGLGYDVITASGTTFRIAYNGGGGNDVTLTAVPEPATFMLIASGGIGLLRRWRRVA